MKGKTDYSSNGHTLVGALVGGPADSNFTYTDSVNDYQANEVALDYNAGLVGAAAGLYSIYKTGSVDSSIEGVSGGAVVTTATTKGTTTTTTGKTTATTKKTTTTTTTKATQKTTVTTTTVPGGSGKTANISTGTQTGTAGDKQAYAEFAPNGAKTATLYYKVKTSDTNSSGAFGTWTGTWEQEDFEVTVGANGQCKVTYNIPSNVGQTVKAMVFYPDASSVKIDKVVLDEGSTPATTASSTKQNPTTTATTVAPGGDDKTANISTGTQTGTAGDKQLYAEFAPNGAKSATLYYTISTKDTNSSGAFGTWTGTWEQTDFDVTVGANGQCTADYVIPSNVGQTVKAMIFYPDASSVKIDKVVLHYGNTVTTGTTKAQPSSGGKYTKDVNQSVVYDELPAGDKMLGWKWSDLGVPAGEKVTKVEINISTSKKQIGKWQGAFGSSTSVAPDYWTQSDDMEQTISGKTGSIVWNVDSATSEIIQTQYGGELKFGVWWIDCNKFTIDSITVYTDAYGSSTTVTTSKTSATTQKTTATTSKTTAKTTSTTKSTTQKPSDLPSASMYGDVNLDGRVDITDAVILNKAVAGAISLNPQQQANADCCTDDGVGANDAIVLLKFLVSLVKTLPSAD